MIETLLQEQLAPVAQRRRQLALRYTLAIIWLAAAVLAAVLLLINRLWGWDPLAAAVALAGATLIVSIAIHRRIRWQGPDYAAIARYIERHHPDLKALLLTAVEQRPETPQGQYNYLQERLIHQAVQHGWQHRWVQTVPPGRLARANYGRFAAAVLLLVVFSQLLRPTSVVLSPQGWLDRQAAYGLQVSPGNAQVEAGSPVVILARFAGKVPAEVTLWMGPSPDELDATCLAKNLDDPVFGTMVPSISQDTVYAIEYDGRRSDMYRLSVFENPELLSVDATVSYPAYTHLPDKTIKDTRRVSVPEGSLVSLDFHLNKPTATAQLLGREGTVLDLAFAPEAPTTGRVRIEARQSERYELKLVDADGRGNKLPPHVSIQVHANQPVEIKTTFPSRDVRPSPLEELTLEAEVQDDYAVTQYGLSYTVAGQDSQTVELGPADEAGAQKNTVNYILDLEALHVQPDQLLTYYFWATDAGPDQTARRAAGDMFFVEIRPFEEAFQESQSFQDPQDQDRNRDQQPNQDENASGQRNTEQLIQRQKEIISATWNLQRQAGQAGRSESFADDAGTIRQSQDEVRDGAQAALDRADDPDAAQALGQAVRHIESALEQLAAAQAAADATALTPALQNEQAAYQEFLKLRGREFQVARAQTNRQGQQSADSAGQRSQQQLQQLELQQRENRYETERRASLENQNQANQRENLQLLNRLRELARRQNDVSEKLKELQAELRQADPAQQEEIRRQLQRLREQQQQLLGDMDELQERLDRPENRPRLADADRQLDQTRRNMQQATEQMADGRLSSAVSSTSRAGRQLEEVRDEIRGQTANQFDEQMRQMRRQAQQLDREEQEIAERIRQAIEDQPQSLSDAAPQERLAERIDQQRQLLEDLADQMRTVSEQAEESEPLLSGRLYDSLRQNRTDDIDRSLEITGELLKRNFLPEAGEMETYAGRQIEQLRRGVEEAAEGVLGSQAETLRQARRQLEDLIRQARPQEAGAPAAAAGSDDPNRLQLIAQNLPERGAAPPETTDDAAGNRQSRPRTAPPSDQQESDSSNRPPRDGQNPPDADGRAALENAETPATDSPAAQDSPSPGQAGGESAGQRRSLREAAPGAAGGNRPFDRLADPANRIGGGAIIGDDYRQWSDRLREVEEMLDRPEWQGELARIRQNARQVRTDLQRHGKQPQWDLLRDQIIDPLVDLHRRLGEELALLESDDRLVPIDRDPVPQRYSELVRSYYERLAGGGD
ncbi:MAG: hypothetical protein JW810_09650 [Sedimentisphaerales bacterium]|nr:hypothetical protein [Sedimentisphaerales bacterium]